VRYKWQQNDVAIWDNRVRFVLHHRRTDTQTHIYTGRDALCHV
jgi:alpha-ketoglutarate-dependent taurine dioxygenase